MPRSLEQIFSDRYIKVKNLELIGTDEQVDQNKWGASKTLAISSTQVTGANTEVAGEIIKIRLLMTVSGTGSILRNAIDLVFFDADPSISANTDHYENSANEADDGEGHIEILAGDWLPASDGTDEAAEATVVVGFPFVSDSNGDLYLSVINRGTTAFNDTAGDDERLRATFWIRRDD